MAHNSMAKYNSLKAYVRGGGGRYKVHREARPNLGCIL